MNEPNEDSPEAYKFDLEKHELAEAQARGDALKAVEAMNIPKQIDVASIAFNGLVSTLRRFAERKKGNLLEEHRAMLPFIIGIALRECEYAIHNAAFYMAQVHPGSSISTPESYAEYEGAAYTLFDSLSRLNEHREQSFFRNETPIQDRLNDQVILDGVAIYWLSRASKLNLAGEYEASQKWMFEGLDALRLSEGLYMWDCAIEFEKEDKGQGQMGEARSALARIGANARHAENRSMKIEVFSWLDFQTVQFKSNEAAAMAIVKQQPIAHVTARDWYKEWKKLRSAGKP